MNTNLHKTIGQFTAALVTTFALAIAPVDLQAATITVTNTADTGVGTLRAALQSAHDGDKIVCSLATPPAITLTSGELLVSKSVDLLGAGANSLAVNGNHASRVFHIASGKTVTLAGMTVTNGNMTINGGYGGGIYNDHATLTVSNCIVSGNTATNFGYGGGIYTDPSSAPDIWTLTVVGSTISGNSATLDGGGIDIGRGSALNVISSTVSSNSAGESGGGIEVGYLSGDGTGTVTIANSTVNGNIANFGGGVDNRKMMIIDNCTLSGNTASFGGYGGAINNAYGTLIITCSTLHLNYASYGAGIYNTTALAIGSTILSDLGAHNIENPPNSGGTVMSLGYNLSSFSDSPLLLANATDRVGNVKLGALQDNGGPTFTHAPLPDSPAIDNGKNLSGFATDQRGFPRTNDDLSLTNAMGGDGTDIGAFEFQKVINLAIERDGSGGLFIRFTGAPDVTYRLQRAATVTGTWSDLATNTAPASDLIEYHETNPPPGQAFYRTVQP